MAERFLEKRLAAMKPRTHSKVINMARGMEGVINLGGGDPDFDTPKHIIEALFRAIKKGETHYPPTHGLPELRRTIAEYHAQDGVDWEPSEVTVTAGSGVALFVSMAGTLEPEDDVVLLEPYFMAYSNIVEYLGAKEIGVPLSENYHLDSEALKDRVTPRTKMIVLCNPNNPSGTVYTKEELETIADLALDQDLLVLSDEVYKEFIWDGRRHISIASLPGMRERTILCSSFSKTFAMTGWRLGYTITDLHLASMIQKIPVGYRTSTFVQKAGIEALKGPWEPVEEMAKEYDKRRRFMASRLSEIDGVRCHTPEGAFYLFPDIEALGVGSEGFCESILKEKKILTRPGTAFGASCGNNLRIPLIKPVGSLKEIAGSIEDHIENMY